MQIKIGLETHVQLNSKSKLFCGCKNPVNLKEEPEPDSLTCEICTGMPGSKPTVNKKIIEDAIKIALALNCKVAKEFFFSRKTYFYPDMAKNFQISQYEIPLAENGWLEIKTNNKAKKIRITRVHIEEDPAKLVHIGGLGGKYTLVDYNRSGIPLVEVVTEPDLASPEEARIFLQKLVTILEYLGVYDSTSKAVVKSDANISLARGARIEVKNITGTKEIEQALKYEIVRQTNLIKRSIEIKRETRSWVPELNVTQSLRGKEVEEEYGYIFEPDLPKITLDEKLIGSIGKQLPELPDQKFARFFKQYKLPYKLVESLIAEIDIANLFEQVAKKINPKLAASWIAGPLKKTLNWHNLKFKQSGIKEEWIINLLKLFESGKITDLNTELTIRKMVEEKLSTEKIIEKYKFGKVEVKDLEKMIKLILDKNKKALQDYKKGEKKALHFLIGQVIKETKGKIDASTIRKIILKLAK